MTFPNVPLPVVVDIIFPDDTTETITTDVRGFTAPGGGIRLVSGQQNEQSNPQTGRGELAVDHADGRYDNLNPRSDLFGRLPVGTHLQVSINDSRIAAEDRIRFTHELAMMPPVWEKTGTDVWVPVITTGILGRLAEGRDTVDSPIRRFYLAQGSQLFAYTPLEENSETFNTASNLVPGTSPLVYSTGAPDDFPRRPRFGQDDSCPGSAPLPEWPVLSYFGWSQGTSVAPHEAPWQVHCVFKVPTGETDLYLCEWATSGDHDDWKMRVNSSGELFVEAIDTTSATTLTFTATNFGAVNDGNWHFAAIKVQKGTFFEPDTTMHTRVQVDNVGDQTNTTNTDPGRVTKIRPRPMYVSTTGDPDPIGLGHMAVTGFGNLTIFPSPVDGFNRERAIDRIERLALENNIPITLRHDDVLEDDFERTETDQWGVPDKGEIWAEQETSTADYDFDVDGTTGNITAAINHINLNDLAFAIIPQAPDNMDIHIVAETNEINQFINRFAIAIITRFTDVDNYYMLSIDQVGDPDFDGELAIDKRVAGVTTEINDVNWPNGKLLINTKYNIRAQIDGSNLRLKVWNFDDMEPPEWMVTAVDHDLSTGGFGVGAGLAVQGNTIKFHSIRARALTSQPTGVQASNIDLTNLLQQTIRADGGFLFELPDDVGLLGVPLTSLYNTNPKLTLDYSQGQLSEPFLPVLDRQLLHNDVTVQSDGAEARAVKLTGANSVEEVGRFDRGAISVTTASGLQLDAIANWILHVRTWSGHRFPQITLELQRQEFTNDDALFAAAASVKTGDVIRVSNPPLWLPPGPIDLLVLGRTEDDSQYTFKLTHNTVPYGPYEVATVESPGGLFLPGKDGATASTPDASSLDITGDIDIRVWVTPTTWTPSEEQPFISKYDDSTDNRSYRFSLNTDGTLRLTWSETGANELTADSTVAPPNVQDGDTLALRATMDADDGGGGRIVTFYTATVTGNDLDDPDIIWRQLGSTVTGTSTSIFSGNADLEIGAPTTAAPPPGGVTVTQLTNNSSATDPATTASISPPSGDIVTVLVICARTGGPEPGAGEVDVTGLSLTWTLHTSLPYGQRRRMYLFSATANGNSGQLTIDFTGTSFAEFQWSVATISGATSLGNSGTNSTALAQTLQVTIPDTPAGNDVALAYFGVEIAGVNPVLEAGWDQLSKLESSDVRYLLAGKDPDQDTTPSATWDSDSAAGGIALLAVE